MNWKAMIGFAPACLTLASIGLCAAIGIACAGTGTAVEVKGPGIGITVKHNVAKFTGSLPPGKCLKVDFLDANGNPTGSATVALPGQCVIPAHSASGNLSIVDCPSVGSGPSGVAQRRSGPSQDIVDLFGFPVVLDTNDGGRYSNAIYHFRVDVTTGGDAFSTIEPILLGGPGTPVPDNVDVVSFTQFVPDDAGGMLVRAADEAPFRTFRLDWNTHDAYADLATGTNVVVSHPGNGWEVVEATVGAADILGLGSANTGETTRATFEDAEVIVESGSATFQ